VNIGEVAAASAGDEDLLAGLFGVVEEQDAASAAAGFDGAHEAGGARSEDDDVEEAVVVRVGGRHRRPWLRGGGFVCSQMVDPLLASHGVDETALGPEQVLSIP
jgi:hypothetical protein